MTFTIKNAHFQFQKVSQKVSQKANLYDHVLSCMDHFNKRILMTFGYQLALIVIKSHQDALSKSKFYDKICIKSNFYDEIILSSGRCTFRWYIHFYHAIRSAFQKRGQKRTCMIMYYHA
jgi:hypothetical protein